MKILKIFGVVVGIHIFALVLIFANPGCSSTSKPPVPDDTVSKTEPAPAPVGLPNIAPAPASSNPPPLTFNPDAPAAYATASSAGTRYVPTRPGSPAAGSLVSEPVTDVTPATTYTVVSGDTLSKIAKKTHMTTAELQAANGLKANAMLKPGQKLMIPGKPAAASVAASTNPPGALAPVAKATTESAPAPAAAARVPTEGLKHVVKSGETLGGIARKYDVKMSEIAVANNISDPAKIKPGQELIIPGWDPKEPKSTGKSGKNGKAPASSKSNDAKSMSTPPAETGPIQAVPPATSPIPITPIEDSPIKPAPRP
jgi:LysM repeat protein